MTTDGTLERERTMWERARALRPLILGLGLLGLVLGRLALAEAPNAMACVQVGPAVESVASGETDGVARQPRVTDGG